MRWLADHAGEDAAARLDAVETRGDRVAHYQLYNAAMLEADLRRYEQRYGLASFDLAQRYDQDDLPPEVPRHAANTWVGHWRELEA